MSKSRPGSPEDPQDYAVGNCRPPRETRFKPGQSGNPKGKVKGSIGIAGQIKKQLQREITVTENGVKRKLTLQEVMLASFANKAAKGDIKSAEFLIRLQEKYQDNPDQSFDSAILPAEDQQLVDAYFARRTKENREPSASIEKSRISAEEAYDPRELKTKSGEGEVA